MKAGPKVSVGMPVYNGDRYIRRALDSLLSQSYRDFEIIISDNGSTDSTLQICQDYARKDPRVTVLDSQRNQGMVRNFRRVFEESTGEYFAWAADHDWWHPEWMSSLVSELDSNPAVVLAYPLNVRISENDEVLRGPWKFDTFGVSSPTRRVVAACWRMRAGSMVYGLIRRHALAQAGVFRYVMITDRMLIGELAWYGQFAQVNSILWHRRFDGRFSVDRVRKNVFFDGVPVYAYLPWWVAHSAVMSWNLVIQGTGRPTVTRAAALMLVSTYSLISLGVVFRGLVINVIGLLPYRARSSVKSLIRHLAPKLHRIRE